MNILQADKIRFDLLSMAYDDVMMVNLVRIRETAELAAGPNVVKYGKDRVVREPAAVPPRLLRRRRGNAEDYAAAKRFYDDVTNV